MSACTVTLHFATCCSSLQLTSHDIIDNDIHASLFMMR